MPLSNKRLLANMATWTRLVRFESTDGSIHLGQPIKADLDIGVAVAAGEQPEVHLIEGDIYSGKVTSKTAKIGRLLSPVSRDQCSIIRCLGLNYNKHAAEASMAIPTAPVLFIKPRTSLTGPGEIPISKLAQDQLDYETELACVFSADAKDVTEEDALKYVLGFTASNDVSARKFQLETSQWCFGKGFDNFCPIGPVLVRTSELDPDKVQLKGTLSGEVMQDENTSDMIFSVKKSISYLSQGTTIEKGTVMQLGTPSGIGWMRKPKRIIQDGEEMRIWMDGGIGTLVNTFKIEK
ncbi:MAG: hypothetical protein CYPHOPRED_002642 [Cyphobasidiales sp. Tagirdzhanova-0007]|nr:MAG: hypothetical protein CYPHOPRED_002642 [Cyphobasidiales sp. Tagirdzhanova-0007]